MNGLGFLGGPKYCKKNVEHACFAIVKLQCILKIFSTTRSLPILGLFTLINTSDSLLLYVKALLKNSWILCLEQNLLFVSLHDKTMRASRLAVEP